MRANVAAMKASTTDQFYNVGTGIKTTIRELVYEILEITNLDLEPTFKESGQTFVKNRIGCPIKAHKEINYVYTINLRDGLSS